MNAFWKVLESLDWNIILERFVCEAIRQSIRCDTHVTEKTDDICSTDFLGIGQKLDNFEKQWETEINLRNEKLHWLDLFRSYVRRRFPVTKAVFWKGRVFCSLAVEQELASWEQARVLMRCVMTVRFKLPSGSAATFLIELTHRWFDSRKLEVRRTAELRSRERTRSEPLLNFASIVLWEPV